MCAKATTDTNGILPPTLSLTERLFTWIMTRHRSLVVVVFALPSSLLWDILLWLRQLIVFKMQSAPHQHPERVRKVAAQVKARPKGMKMCTGRPGWQSMSLSYRDCKFAAVVHLRARQRCVRCVTATRSRCRVGSCLRCALHRQEHEPSHHGHLRDD